MKARDLKYRDFLEWALHDPVQDFPLHTFGLHKPARSFQINNRRLANTGRLPAMTALRASRWQKAVKDGGTDQEIEGRWVDSHSGLSEDWNQDILAACDDRIVGTLNEWQFFLAMEQFLWNTLVGAWTAFETLTGDLWEAALNICPTGLAEIVPGVGGNRIAKAVEDTRVKNGWTRPANRRQIGESRPGGESKKISLDAIKTASDGKYDLSCRMGTLLRETYDFHARGIARAAYSSAFWCHSNDIDAALADLSIDALVAVRNLIVHNAGIADRIYVEEDAPGTPAPPMKIGDRLTVDGISVLGIIRPVIARGVDLIKAVDEWIRDEFAGMHPSR